MHNIEKSYYHKGQYVGYGRGGVWHIKKVKTPGGGWEAFPQEGSFNGPTPSILHAKTLSEMGRKLDNDRALSVQNYLENPGRKSRSRHRKRVTKVKRKKNRTIRRNPKRRGSIVIIVSRSGQKYYVSQWPPKRDRRTMYTDNKMNAKRFATFAAAEKAGNELFRMLSPSVQRIIISDQQ